MSFKKLGVACFYYLSVLCWYTFFWGLTLGHGYYFFQSLNVPDCYAVNKKDGNTDLAYFNPDDVPHLKDVTANFRVVNMMGMLVFGCATLIMMYMHCRASCESYY